MIYDLNSLKLKYKMYSNINQKISIETRKGKLTRIKKGLYTDDLISDKLVISNVCLEPSYISFEYALSYYGIIPEFVSTITCASLNKKNNKKYSVDDIMFDYRSIPANVYFYGITFLKNEKGINYKIATKEKALCDLLYSNYPVRFIKDLKVLLFENLRIDENDILNMDLKFIKFIAPLYHSNTIYTLVKYMEKNNDSN